MDTTNNRSDQVSALKKKILVEHQDQPHPEISQGALRAHLLVHGMIEMQLLNNDPPEVRHVFETLLDKGMERHTVIHVLGKIVTREALDMIKNRRELDRPAYVAALRALVDQLDE